VGCGRSGADGLWGAEGSGIAGVPARATGDPPGPLATRTGSAGRSPPGRGCLGPDRICPGLGAAGTGLAGGATGRLGMPGVAVLWAGAGGAGAGAAGAPGEAVASGGRKRCGCGTTRWGIASSGAISRAGCGSRPASRASAWGASGCSAAIGSSATAAGEPFELLGSTRVPLPPCPKIWRSFSATSSSTELECVFFSVTPNSGSLSSSS